MPQSNRYDFVIIGSGFGGSVSAMRLTEKGYSVLVLEKGKRFEEKDFAKTNWQFWKYLWAPALRAHGILQISILKGVMVLHGAGVGGGSLGYANVLEVPGDQTFATPAWNRYIKWGEVLRPHFETAKGMLGAARNPKLWHADHILRQMAEERSMAHTFRATDVGVFFGEAEQTVPDPYFGGEGPARAGCNHCGGCMVGCRYNAKNTLPKNYLYFAEKNGAEVRAEAEVVDVRPLTMNDGQSMGQARYVVTYQSSTSALKPPQLVYAKNVIFSAGVMGTMKLLLTLRDVRGSLPRLSRRLGHMVRTNSEALLGSVARKSDINYSEGIAISSIYNHDPITRLEPVRYPDGSSLMRFLAAPLIDRDVSVPARIRKFLGWILTHPIDAAKALVLPGWAHNVTIMLVMQHIDNAMRLKIGRSAFTLFRRGMVVEREAGHEIQARIQGSHELTRDFAGRTNGVALGSLGENLLGLPTTAHILGGAPVGQDAGDGVVAENFEVHNYPGLYIVDGSIMPANPGVNPSLTITALAEYAMSKIPENPVGRVGDARFTLSRPEVTGNRKLPNNHGFVVSMRADKHGSTQPPSQKELMTTFSPTSEFAAQLDRQDPLASYREQFVANDPDLIYLDGNSLGRLPKRVVERMQRAVEQEWGDDLIRSWNRGWWEAPGRIGDKIGSLLGAAPGQVLVGDQTSINLFKLATAALNLQPHRRRIVTDTFNFPSDLYILQGIVRLLGDRHEIIRIGAQDDDITPDLDALEAAINEDTALVTLSHVTFKSGYLYDMAAITDLAHRKGALVLWDLSHSAGSVPVELDTCEADFAIGCTYKYLNGGPGAPAFLYVNKRIQDDVTSPIWGWWGQRNPFEFDLDYQPASGAQRFLVGTAPMLSTLAMEEALMPMLDAGMAALRAKSIRMTDYAVLLTDHVLAPLGFSLGSPRDSARRGSHISVRHDEGYRINRAMIEEMNVIPDFRAPNNIRLGFAPLYLSFRDVWEGFDRMRRVVEEKMFEKYPRQKLTVT